MAHALSLCAQVLFVLRVGGGLQRHALDDVEPVTLESSVLRRVVGHEAHLGHPELHEDLGPDAVLPAIYGKPELDVGINGVPAVVLQVVGPQLVGEADATSLVAAQVHDDADALGSDPSDGGFELGTAVASK